VSSQYFRINAGGAEPNRSLLFEQLLARAECQTSMADWRAEAFSFIAPRGLAMPPIAAAALCAERGAVQSGWVCLATPVHYIAEMTRVRLPENGILALAPAAAEALALDFNRVWQGAGVSLTAARSGQLFCLFDQQLDAITRDPREALGQSIEEYLPTGEGSAALRNLISETEMWLFQHGVNEARHNSGEQLVNGLWFWGGGAPLAALPQLQGWVGGRDDFFDAFGARREAGLGSGVVTIDGDPGSPQWLDSESCWLRPALAQLRGGDLSRLEISIKHWRFTLNSRTLRRFWRRRKPWWELLA
jgi:hypothetical protein